MSERVGELEFELQERAAELGQALDQQQGKDDQIKRLSATLEKMLNESNDKMQQYLSEKMKLNEEKASLVLIMQFAGYLIFFVQMTLRRDLESTRSDLVNLREERVRAFCVLIGSLDISVFSPELALSAFCWLRWSLLRGKWPVLPIHTRNASW